jgi:hypothetical protein
MLKIKKNPSARELRQFAGLWFPAFCGLVGWLVQTRAGLDSLAMAIWSLGALLAIAGLVRPAVIRPVFIGMMMAAFPIGWVVSHLVLAVVYYVVLTPIGLAMRVLGRDPMQRRRDPAAKSYWEERPAAMGTERYFRQF